MTADGPETEPLDDAIGRRDTAPASGPAPDRTFASTRYQFDTGVRAGETATIRDANNEVVLSYRGFATIINIVAALVAGLVMVAGLAATLFLINEHQGGRAAAALLLSILFSLVIAALVPPIRVTIYQGAIPVLHVIQTSRAAFPSMKFSVQTSDFTTIAHLRRSMVSRLARNTWSIDAPADQHGSGFAVEESFWRALVRKVAGKFSRAREANIRIYHQGLAAGLIVRRSDASGDADYLDLAANSTLDRRVAVALATLVFGAEP